MKPRRARLLLCLILLLLPPLAVLGWSVYRQARQIRLNAALIIAVKRNDLAAGRRLLAQGADTDSRDIAASHLSLWQLLLTGMHHKPVSADNSH